MTQLFFYKEKLLSILLNLDRNFFVKFVMEEISFILDQKKNKWFYLLVVVGELQKIQLIILLCYTEEFFLLYKNFQIF